MVNSSGTDPNGERFDYLNTELRKMNADIIDEHYYRRPEWFLANAARYDNYQRNGVKIFAGEYAAQSDHTVSIENKNNLETAIAEAAFMTGLERNAAVVSMASYAPLFAHIDGWQWTPDLIWVNNLQSYGTPNYYVQKLFSSNKGTNVVPALMDGKSIAGQDSMYVSAVTDTNTHDIIIKVVNASSNVVNKMISITGARKLSTAATLIILKSNSLLEVNTFATPDVVSPVTATMQLKGNKLTASLLANSLTVYRIGMK